MLFQIFRCRTHYKMVSNVLSMMHGKVRNRMLIRVYRLLTFCHLSLMGLVKFVIICIQDLIHEIMDLASRKPLTKLPQVNQFNLNSTPTALEAGGRRSSTSWRVETSAA